MSTAVGVFRLPRSFAVDAPVLGRAFPSTLGEWSISIHFPTVAWQTPDDPSFPYLRTPDFLDSDIVCQSEVLGSFGWGSTGGYATSPSGPILHGAKVEAIAIRVEHRVDGDDQMGRGDFGQPEADPIFDGIDAWADRFISWIEVLTGHADTPEVAARRSVSHGAGLALWPDGASGLSDLASRRAEATSVNLEVATVDNVQLALDQAARNRDIDVEHALLRDARISFALGQYRRAVIEAASGAEVGLMWLLRQRLEASTIGPDLVALLMGEKRTLDPLARFVGFFGIGGLTQTAVRKGLAEPRNKAVHEAEVLSRDEAAKAIDIAAQIIRAARPLEGEAVTGVGFTEGWTVTITAGSTG